jgi:hypothetical protein
MERDVFCLHGGKTFPHQLIIYRVQVRHLMGGNCLLTPPQLKYNSAKDFNTVRALRNDDGTYMVLYFRLTHQSGAFLTSLSAVGEALLKRGKQLGVNGMEHWATIQKGSLDVINDIRSQEES